MRQFAIVMQVIASQFYRDAIIFREYGELEVATWSQGRAAHYSKLARSYQDWSTV
jgi:hypothetical protein